MTSELVETIIASLFTCEICLEPALPIDQKFSHRHNHHCAPNICDPKTCDRKICAPNICVTCWVNHIQAKVDENRGSIRCPSCDKTLNPVECRPLIPAEIFVKWCDCLCKSSVSMSKSSHCPYRDCSELILNECDDTTKKSACPRCKGLFCFACRAPWHAGFRCSESTQEWDSNDRKFGFLVEKMKWTRCPGCGQPTDRVGGCPIILCRCGRRFCHNCGKASLLHSCDCYAETGRPIGLCVQLGWWLIFFGTMYLEMKLSSESCSDQDIIETI